MEKREISVFSKKIEPVAVPPPEMYLGGYFHSTVFAPN